MTLKLTIDKTFHDSKKILLIIVDVLYNLWIPQLITLNLKINNQIKRLQRHHITL